MNNTIDKLNTSIQTQINYCSFAKYTHNKLYTMIINGKSIKEVFAELAMTIQNLLDGNITYSDLVIRRRIHSRICFMSENYCMKIFIEKYGRTFDDDIVKFIVVDIPNEQLLGNRMIPFENYMQSLDTDNPYCINYKFYIDKQLYPIEKLFKVGFKTNIPQNIPRNISYQRNKHSRRIFLNEPVKLILSHLSNYSSLNNIIDPSYQFKIDTLRHYLPKIHINMYIPNWYALNNLH